MMMMWLSASSSSLLLVFFLKERRGLKLKNSKNRSGDSRSCRDVYGVVVVDWGKSIKAGGCEIVTVIGNVPFLLFWLVVIYIILLLFFLLSITKYRR